MEDLKSRLYGLKQYYNKIENRMHNNLHNVYKVWTKWEKNII